MKETRSNFRVTPKLNSGDNKLSVFSIIFSPSRSRKGSVHVIRYQRVGSGILVDVCCRWKIDASGIHDYLQKESKQTKIYEEKFSKCTYYLQCGRGEWNSANQWYINIGLTSLALLVKNIKLIIWQWECVQSRQRCPGFLYFGIIFNLFTLLIFYNFFTVSDIPHTCAHLFFHIKYRCVLNYTLYDVISFTFF